MLSLNCMKALIFFVFVLCFSLVGLGQNKPTSLNYGLNYGHLQTTISNFEQIQNKQTGCDTSIFKNRKNNLNSCPKILSDLIESEAQTKFAVYKSNTQTCRRLIDEKNPSVNWQALRHPFEFQKIIREQDLWKSNSYSHQVVQSCASLSGEKAVMTQAKFYYYLDRLNFTMIQNTADQNLVSHLLGHKNLIACPASPYNSVVAEVCEQNLKCTNWSTFSERSAESEKDEKLYQKIKEQVKELKVFCSYNAQKKNKCLSSEEKQEREKALLQIQTGLEIKNPWFLNKQFQETQSKVSFAERFKTYLLMLEANLKNQQKTFTEASACLHGENYYLNSCSEESLREVLSQTSQTPSEINYAINKKAQSKAELSQNFISQMSQYQSCVETDAIEKNNKAKTAKQISQALVAAALPLGQEFAASRLGLMATERLLHMSTTGTLASSALFGSVQLIKETAPQAYEKCMTQASVLTHSKTNPLPQCKQSQQFQSAVQGSAKGDCLIQLGTLALNVLPAGQLAIKAKSLAEVSQPLRRASDLKDLSKGLQTERRSQSMANTQASELAADNANSRSLVSSSTKRVVAAQTTTAINKQVIRSSEKIESLPSIAEIPETIQLNKVTLVNGEEKITYKKAVQLPGGSWVSETKDLSIDSITGAINANFPSGREFFDMLLKRLAGKGHFAFIDVGSLGAVNKTFKAGEKAGDQYLKAVADKILQINSDRQKLGLKPQITLARLGGDEFGILIDESNPVAVKKILENLQSSIRKDLDGEAHQVFRAEKIERANAYKEAKAAGEDLIEETKGLNELAKTQRPDISIGSTAIGEEDSLASSLVKTEEQAAQMKIPSALNNGRPADKYGNYDAPKATPNPRFTATVAEPLSYQQIKKASLASASDAAQARSTSIFKPNFDVIPAMQYRDIEVVKRFGSMKLVKREDQLGRASYKIENYYTDSQTGMKYLIESEVPTRGNTGLLDGMHPESQKLIMEHLHEVSTSMLVLPKLESLKYFNYFQEGSKAGDTMLEIVSEAIRKQMRSSDLTFKLPGNDFLWSLEGISKDRLQKLAQTIREQVLTDPRTVKILEKEKSAIKLKLQDPITKKNSKAVQKLTERLSQLENFNLDLTFRTMSPAEAQKAKNFKELTQQLENKPAL